MAKNKDDLFCFFSGFAHQDIEIYDYQENSALGIIILTCRNRSKHVLTEEDYIQLDRILFQVI